MPNLPGALTRQLSARLGVDATAAMRIALLYGDIEWQAAGEPTVRYSARDYARRQGFHPHTVQADLRRLIAIGALEARYDVHHGATLSLCGLLDATADPPRACGPLPRRSWSMPAPRWRRRLVEPITQPWVMPSSRAGRWRRPH